MHFAKDFTIMRSVTASGRISLPLAREPEMVVTLIDEAKFVESGHLLIHNRTVFLEDRMHDWTWDNGQFRYFTRVAEVADVVLIYELGDVCFCPECGAKAEVLGSLCKACTGNTGA